MTAGALMLTANLARIAALFKQEEPMKGKSIAYSSTLTLFTQLTLTAVIVTSLLANRPAQAQTYNVIYNFTGGTDGATPYAGLTMDQVGNLYGTAADGGSENCGGYGCGTVFRLKRSGASWVFNPLYNFEGSDGANPLARVVFGPDGSLYGTTVSGGGFADDGTVFNLKPQATSCKTALCPWTETVLYNFANYEEGANPYSEVTFDQAGNLYGTTQYGGSGECGDGCGVVFELAHSGNNWTYSPIYEFTNGGAGPTSSVIFDGAGNLYGSDDAGGANELGTVYELIPSGSGWTEKVLYNFEGGSDGARPAGGLIFDTSGNLYGTTTQGGNNGGGTVFELSPSSNGNWTYNLLYSFSGNSGGGPQGSLAMDAAGNLYGTTWADGAYGYGSVFKLTHSGNSWTYSSLHDFTAGSDGSNPYCNVVLDSHGDLYGTTTAGGTASACSKGCGVVFTITPQS